MCTIGYNKRLNIMFKNRDKTCLVDEVTLIRPELFAVKSEGGDYYSLGVNNRGVAFVSAAVNTPLWTHLAMQDKFVEAANQYQLENVGLVNPIKLVSNHLSNAGSAEDILEALLSSSAKLMGYNLILADRDRAVHVELYRDKSHVEIITDKIVLTNHFSYLNHGPKKMEDYPSSFERLEAANNFYDNLHCLEDVFNQLIPGNERLCPYWRNGTFSTVSSSILDLDSSTIYYCPSPESGFSRLTRGIPPKGRERAAIEMSRYIDLPTYHRIERAHPFYEEMLQEIVRQIDIFHRSSNFTDKVKTLEIGAGTGLCSLELVSLPSLELHCLELDSECCAILAAHPEAKQYKVIQGDAVTFWDEQGFDLIISTFAHDHINYNRRFAFAENIKKNLRPGGAYIMGGELLPYFSSDMERKKSLFTYHNYIIELALRENRVQLCELENNALKSGLDLVGDFKRHEEMFEDEMHSAGFKNVEKIKLGPIERDDVGGVFVYVCKT